MPINKGNKTRKLEFIMPDAIKNKADLVVTVGAIQSNHARQTAAACAVLGIKCLIVLEQRLANAPESYMNSGNIFLTSEILLPGVMQSSKSPSAILYFFLNSKFFSVFCEKSGAFSVIGWPIKLVLSPYFSK